MDKMGRYKKALSMIDNWLNFQMYIKEIRGLLVDYGVESIIYYLTKNVNRHCGLVYI